MRCPACQAEAFLYGPCRWRAGLALAEVLAGREQVEAAAARPS